MSGKKAVTMTEAGKRERFGDLLKPPPLYAARERKGKASKSEDAKPPAPTWPVRSTGNDFWHRDAMTTLRRFHAEGAVREYAKAQAWGELRFRHVPELLREVPTALWSCTVRDLIAEAVILARLDVASVAVTGKDVPLEESRPAVSSARPEKLPKVLREFARPTVRQAEAAAMLADVARFFDDPPRLGDPLPDLDTAAKRKARDSKRKLNAVRDDFAAMLGMKERGVEGETARPKGKATRRAETFARLARRAKAGPKKPQT